MATSRIFFENFLISTNPLVTLFASGGAVAQSAAAISGIQPIKVGYVTGTASGTYSDIVDKLYRVEIQSAGSGAFGSATWRWTDKATASPIVWNASGLATTNGANVALNTGVLWRFDQMGAFTPQFVLGDYWLFEVSLKYGHLKGLDGTRDHEYRSGTMPISSTIEHRYDMGTAVNPSAFALLDHNIPSNATIALKPKSTGFTDPPAVTVPITWNSGKIAAVLTAGAFRYWRVCVTLAGTALTYLRWSELFLGDSLVFDTTFNVGYQRSKQWLETVNIDTLRRGPGPLLLEGDSLRLTYAHMSAADRARMNTLRAWIRDTTNRVQRSFYVVVLDTNMADFSLYHWANDYIEDHRFLERSDTPVEWPEVIRSRVA